jgi:hypothetical protein
MVLKLKAFTIFAPVLLVISVGGLNSNACVLRGKGRRSRRTEFPVPARKRRSAWCLRMTAKVRFGPSATRSANDKYLRIPVTHGVGCERPLSRQRCASTLMSSVQVVGGETRLGPVRGGVVAPAEMLDQQSRWSARQTICRWPRWSAATPSRERETIPSKAGSDQVRGMLVCSLRARSALDGVSWVRGG